MGEQLVIWRSTITPKSYTVLACDNISSIAKRYKTTIAALEKLNPILKSKILKEGQRLII